MSIAAYQTLYESSVAFGMRKALQAEQGKTDMENKIRDLEEEKRQLEQTVLELKAKCEAIEKREGERRAMEERKHAEEIAFLKKTNVQLKTQLEGILTPSYDFALIYQEKVKKLVNIFYHIQFNALLIFRLRFFSSIFCKTTLKVDSDVSKSFKSSAI